MDKSLHRKKFCTMAGKCEWELREDSTVGSDHYPVFYTKNVDRKVMVEERDAKWIFSEAKWDQFEYLLTGK